MTRRGQARALLAGALIAAGVGAGAAPAAAVTYPPPVSDIRAVVTDHQVLLTFDVPAAYYSPGAHGVVRATVLHTPAPTPTFGYPVRVSGRTASSYFLNDRTVYTFAIWVYADGRYSARRSITVTTPADITPPHPLAAVTAVAGVALGCLPAVSLHFALTARDIDVFTVRIVRNTRYTTTGGEVFTASPYEGVVDTYRLAAHTRYYYWAITQDAAGHFAPYYVGVSVVTTTPAGLTAGRTSCA